MNRVALIAGAIEGTVQFEAVRTAHPLGVVTGGERLRPEIACEVEEIAELDALIAAHAGHRSAASGVRVREILDHRLPKTLFEIEHVMGNPEPLGDRARILDVAPGAAALAVAADRALVVKLQCHAHHLEAQAVQQGGSDRTVDAARHGDYHPCAGRQVEVGRMITHR